MSTLQFNVRLPGITVQKINDLATKYGSQARAIVAAVENLHKQEIANMNTLRIKRTEKKITIETQMKPDLAGNRNWRVIGEFQQGDQIKTDTGWKNAFDCSDAEIAQALKETAA
jgi:CRP-like cAMP-binding protein